MKTPFVLVVILLNVIPGNKSEIVILFEKCSPVTYTGAEILKLVPSKFIVYCIPVFPTTKVIDGKVGSVIIISPNPVKLLYLEIESKKIGVVDKFN